MAAEFDWEGFGEEISKTIGRGISDIQQQEDEKRLEQRQLRIAKEMQNISLEGLNKKLEIEEPFKKDADARLLKNRQILAEEADGRQRAFIEWQEEFSQGIDIFSGSEGYQKAIEKAQKEGGLSQVSIMKMEESIMRAKAGQPADIAEFDGLNPFDRMKVMDLVKRNNLNIQEHQRKMSEITLRIRQNDELISYRKNQERLARQREERLVTGAGLALGRQLSAERTRLDTAVEKAEKTFSDFRTELFTELEDTNKINAKGEAFATIGGRKKIKLIDPETGELNEKAVETFVKKYTRYRGRFKRLKELRKSKDVRNERRDEFFGGEPAGKPAEVEVPEAEIRAAMGMGLTREQAIEQYKKFLKTKK